MSEKPKRNTEAHVESEPQLSRSDMEAALREMLRPGSTASDREVEIARRAITRAFGRRDPRDLGPNYIEPRDTVKETGE